MAAIPEREAPLPVRSDTKSSSRPRNPRRSLARISSNLLLLSSLVVLLALWILYYTDWSLLLGGLAGIGAVFTLLVKFLTDPRKKQLRRAFEARFLARPLATWVAVFLFASLLAATYLSGTVVIRSLRDDHLRSFSITDPREGTVATDLIPGRSGKKLRLWRGLNGRRELRVKISGLPSKTIRLRPFARTILDSPDDFLRRAVVLVRPTPMLSRLATNARLWLIVQRGKESDRIPFSGKAVWIGCDAEVAVPPEMKNRWQLELQSQDLSSFYMDSWLPPVAQNTEWSLAPGDRLRISIQTERGTPYGQAAQLTIPHLVQGMGLPLEVVLDVPHSR